MDKKKEAEREEIKRKTEEYLKENEIEVVPGFVHNGDKVRIGENMGILT